MDDVKKSHTYIEFNSEKDEYVCHGKWNISHVKKLKKEIDKTFRSAKDKITINGKDISELDSVGAWLLCNEIKKISKKDLDISYKDFSKQHQKLLSLIDKNSSPKETIPKVKELGWVAQLGKFGIGQSIEAMEYLNFLGRLVFENFKAFCNPASWRWSAIISTVNRTGTQALPIVALLSFMIGIVISYQMGNQLREYGANIFIVNLLGLSVLREFGPMLTAIMVAGRTGSAFAAQLGIMKINQEIDALNTMGLTPAVLLLLPRLFGLLIVLPLLTIWADIFGVFGGMIMAQNMLDVSWYEFLRRFQQEIPLRSLLIGICKAPVFALIIATISCFEGMNVKHSAESVGEKTTRSVVLAIFFIIVIDAGFSVLFSKYEL